MMTTAANAAATAVNNNNNEHLVHVKAAALLQVDDLLVMSAIRRQHMKDVFQPWVMQTYGDTAKTKTISRRKADRISKILRGEDSSNGADSSKFRFWVRAKGFRLGAPQLTAIPSQRDANDDINGHHHRTNHYQQPQQQQQQPMHHVDDPEELYVVTSTGKDEVGDDQLIYKKVAVVEEFFDIIYREHVEFGGRSSGKHAGQKRTYRAITEIYAFLPREAVTRFLMQCADCQRRGSSIAGVAGVATASGSTSSAATRSASATVGASSPPSSPVPSPLTVSPGSPTPPASPTWKPPSDASTPVALWQPPPLPPSLTSSSHLSMVAQGSNGAGTTSSSSSWSSRQLCLPLDNIDLSLPLTSTLLKHAKLSGLSHRRLFGLDKPEASFSSESSAVTNVSILQGMTATAKSDDEVSAAKATSSCPGSSQLSNSVPTGPSANLSVAMATATPALPSRPTSCSNLLNNDPASPITLDLSSKAEMMEDHSPGAMKDDDDDDDDDAEDKIDNQICDPERLKAFNMFVRLFVDENLDRMVPISRQPREKVQAIIDSCLRQFPEFGERARKRIRTYLKSCRRNKRSRDSLTGLDTTTRPMPPHLTSAAAEQILAQACENENQNAKRLRMGLEPISQPLPINAERFSSDTSLPTSQSPSNCPPVSSGMETSPSLSTSASGTFANLFRPAFGPYQRSTAPSLANPSSNTCAGPTDLSTKSRPPPLLPSSNGTSLMTNSNSNSNRTSPLPHKLNTAEILAVRQLVTGYRESAAFLLRSADELEQLLQQQHSSC